MKHLILGLNILICLCAHSQITPVYKEGNPVDREKKTVDPRRVVYADENGCLMIGNADGDLGIQHIGNDLAPSAATVIDNRNADDEVLRGSGALVFNNMLCIFWIREDGKANKFILYYQFADVQTGKQLTEKTALVTANTYSDAVLSMYAFESDYYHYFRTALSPDRSKLLVMFPQNPGGKDPKQSYAIHVFDSLMHPVRNTTHTFDFLHGYYLLKDIMITNDGEVVFSGIETLDEHKVNLYQHQFPYMRPVGMFHVTIWKNGTDRTRDNTIKVDGKLVTDVAFRYDGKSMQVMGFWSPTVEYSNRIKMDLDRWYCKGSFFQEINPDDLAPIAQNLNTFDQKLIDDCDIWVAPKKTDVDRRKIEVFCLTAQEILRMPSGDFVLLSEQLTAYTETSIYSGNIVVCRYDQVGEHKVTTNIPRLEILFSPTRFTREYAYYTKGENIAFIYSKGLQGAAYKIATKNNEAVRQADIPDNAIVHAMVSPEGGLKKTVLKDEEGNGYFLVLQSTVCDDKMKTRMFFATTDMKSDTYASVDY